MEDITANQWYIPSNRGHASVKFEAIVFHENIGLLEWKIELVGSHWYRPEFLKEPAKFERIVDDYSLTLSQVLVAKSECHELLRDFENWLDTHSPFVRTICSRPDQECVIEVGKRDGYITSDDHPSCQFRYSGGCALDVAFNVDESCIRIARNGLSRVLEAFEKSE